MSSHLSKSSEIEKTFSCQQAILKIPSDMYFYGSPKAPLINDNTKKVSCSILLSSSPYLKYLS